MFNAVQKFKKDSRGMKEDEIENPESENINIQLHLNTSGKLSFDIRREMSVSARH